MTICNTNYCFKDVNNISEDLLLNILESNLKNFFDWSFLRIGAWFDSKINDTNIYGGNQQYQLVPVKDESYPDGSVWQGVRKDWVWEKGQLFQTNSPIEISGLYINGNFLPKNNNFIINYPNGKIILNNPIALNSIVLLSHSYRNIQVYRSTDSPWLQILQQASFDTNNKDITKVSTGEWSIGPHKRIQTPCIIIESISRSRSRPHEIGNNGLIIEQDILLHVLADNRFDRNKILDIIRLQQDIGIWLYDTNQVAKNDDYPLDFNEDIKNNPLMYPDLVNKYKWRKCWFKNVSLIETLTVNTSLHQGLARVTAEIIYT